VANSKSPRKPPIKRNARVATISVTQDERSASTINLFQPSSEISNIRG